MRHLDRRGLADRAADRFDQRVGYPGVVVERDDRNGVAMRQEHSDFLGVPFARDDLAPDDLRARRAHRACGAGLLPDMHFRSALHYCRAIRTADCRRTLE